METKTYFIEDISVKILQGPEIHYKKRPEMHPVRRDDQIKQIPYESINITANRFKNGNKVFYLAWKPEIENFLGLQLSAFTSLQDEINSLRSSLVKERAEIKSIKSLSFFGRLKFLFTGKA